MNTKLLHSIQTLQFLHMSQEDYDLLRQTDIELNVTCSRGDFMLLANTKEVAFLTKCGLDLSEIYADYYIVIKED